MIHDWNSDLRSQSQVAIIDNVVLHVVIVNHENMEFQGIFYL